ncbi:hypothetical protein BW143_21395 [Bacillus swezeyi]|uniref:Uncharacterized protein n=1 Tax=Bacillus swezeyi TaxID=1925020 RepID=A0A1R1Q7G1_9BACI|nr:hypothetical protein BW143_21395 [Bacillus swezeyi]
MVSVARFRFPKPKPKKPKITKNAPYKKNGGTIKKILLVNTLIKDISMIQVESQLVTTEHSMEKTWMLLN